MNRSSPVWHLLLKDLRYQRGWLALLWFLAVLLPFLAPLTVYDPAGTSSAMNPSLIGAAGGFDFLLGLILIRVIQLDPPGRSVHFLATRPVSWQAILGGKIVFASLFLIVPVWIAKLGTVYLARIPFNSLDVVLCLIEITIEAGALLAVVVAFALFIRSLPLVFLSLLGYLLLGLVASTIWSDYSAHSHTLPRYVDSTLNACRFLVWGLAFIVTVRVAALVRYRTKTAVPPLVILIAGFAFSWIVSAYWPYDLSRFFSDQPSTVAEVASPLRDNIRLTLTGREGVDGNYLEEGDWNGIRYFYLNHEVQLEGVEPPYFAKLADFQAEITLKSGRTIQSSYGGMALHGVENGINASLLQQMAGFTPAFPPPWSRNIFEISNYRPEPLQNEDLTGASLKGMLTLEIRRAILLQTLPLRSGATLAMDRRRYTVRNVEFTSSAVSFDFIAESAPLTLRGDSSEWGLSGILSVLVQNRSKGEYLDSGRNAGVGGLGAEVAFYGVDVRHCEFTRAMDADGKKSQEPIPVDWADHAEISFFTSESCGRISLPYELPSVDLKH